MKFSVMFLACLVCGALANPVISSTESSTNFRDWDFMAGTKVLIMDLIRNLHSAAECAMDSVNIFTTGLEHQVHLFEEKLENDLQKLKERIDVAIKSIADRFSGAEGGFKACVENYKSVADDMYGQVYENIQTCGKTRVDEVRIMIEDLMSMTNNATAYATNARTEISSCYETSKSNFFELTKCMGSIAVQAEIKGAGYMAQSGLLVGRINLSLATLPAALEVCAGSGLVEAGVRTAKIVMDVGSCSASSLYSALTFSGNETSTISKKTS